MIQEPNRPIPPEDLHRGLPLTAHDPLGFEGSIEQVGKMAAGLRSRRDGWRRVVARGGLAALAVAAAVIAISNVVGRP